MEVGKKKLNCMIADSEENKQKSHQIIGERYISLSFYLQKVKEVSEER